MTKTLIVGNGGAGRRVAMRYINVGTIGHVDHGKRNLTTLALMVINASAPEMPECYLEPEAKQPYYRRFEKKAK